MTVAMAKARYLRISPRKLNRVLYAVRKKTVYDAYRILPFINLRASEFVLKAIKSAHSNMGKNIDPKKVMIKEIYVNEGPSMKRIMPMAYGRWAIFKRRTSHLVVILEEINGTENKS